MVTELLWVEIVRTTDTLQTMEPEKLLLSAELRHGVNTRDFYGETALHRAALFGRPALAASLLEHGADPFLRNKDGYSPYQLAIHAPTRAVIAKVRSLPAGAVQLLGPNFVVWVILVNAACCIQHQ